MSLYLDLGDVLPEFSSVHTLKAEGGKKKARIS